ncbi:hypothetical protein AEA09_14800 [Lysinibacillus contaminans]|uniref:HTH cro/C1-type domain-containing protein n=1 Tax=Lysinibacillus contaminans TaxID=1293441 RepID=A0ABR5JXU9_9BACI|nr:helix-turn-helix transcriptional regulator [Lysinibacillus contaminans]KOS67119.1 hypothetical protein AEA09_14800 [Lysinibacillus contaminans]
MNAINKELIKHLRSIANLSQDELAKRLGVHQTLVSKIEAGLVELQPRTEQKLMNVFKAEGITPKDIALLQSVFTNRNMKITPIKKD